MKKENVSRQKTVRLNNTHAGKRRRALRAYTGSEFVVANTLAKWKKLEPDEILTLAKVLATLCFVFNSAPKGRLLLSADNLC